MRHALTAFIAATACSWLVTGHAIADPSQTHVTPPRTVAPDFEISPDSLPPRLGNYRGNEIILIPLDPVPIDPPTLPSLHAVEMVLGLDGLKGSVICCDANDNCEPLTLPGTCPAGTITSNCDDDNNCVDEDLDKDDDTSD